MTRRYGAPMTAPQANRPSTWSTCGPRPVAWRWASPGLEEKSNEITAIPKLLQLLELAGCIVTIDAMGCQKEIAREIIEAQADYLLALKENQGRLYEDVRDLFEGAQAFDFAGVPYDFARTVNKNHGRLETRQCWVITDPDCLVTFKTVSSGPSSTPW